ncbi:hypothetical protein ACMFMG_005228 [Clarireedia jacksonii]
MSLATAISNGTVCSSMLSIEYHIPNNLEQRVLSVERQRAYLDDTDHTFLPLHPSARTTPAIILVEKAKAKMQVKIESFERAFTTRKPDGSYSQHWT